MNTQNRKAKDFFFLLRLFLKKKREKRACQVEKNKE